MAAGRSFKTKAPGRMEICGNHCDHQNGQVVAAAVDRFIKADVTEREDSIVRIKSEGFEEFRVDLTELSVHDDEKGTSKALVRGIAKALSDAGVRLSGFDAYITSEVGSGSGMSSSAAFEVLIGRIMVKLSGQEGDVSAMDIAKAGRFAENVYFGKPCGLMDQAASSLENPVYIDFENTDEPVYEVLPPVLEKNGYSICLLNTGTSHDDLTWAYAAIPHEMKKIASYFGKEVLRQVDESTFLEAVPELRSFAGDRAVMRAMHFFDESRRSRMCRDAAVKGDPEGFIRCINESGESSIALLQNIDMGKDPKEQGMALAIALSKKILNGRGAVRINGGGFAGTMLAVMPEKMTEEYISRTEKVFGSGSVSLINMLCRSE